MKPSASSIRVRFAPSPTGHLHIGSLRTALFNYLFAKHTGGAFLLRIEDTDLERSSQEYVESLFKSLAWVGLQPDEPVVIQSSRLAQHKEVIEMLLASGKAYRCYCSQEEVAARHHERFDGDAFIKYDRLCRFRTNEPIDKSFAVRFALPENRDFVEFDDLVRGTIIVGLDQLDDFVIARSDGMPIYNFVVVIDDATMAVTHVIRGDDHISNTPKQILLYEACGYSVPHFAHTPLILGPSGARLSKRDAATSALDYCLNGYLPDALMNYLVRLGWAHGDQEIFSMDELIALFSIEQLGKKSAIFDIQKLQWLNGVYMRQKSAFDLCEYAQTYMIQVPCVAAVLHKRLSYPTEAMIDLYKGRVHTLLELFTLVERLMQGPDEYASDDVTRWMVPSTDAVLDHLIVCLRAVDEWNVERIQHDVKTMAKTNGFALSSIAHPVRLALQGVSEGPGLFELLAVVGKHESIKRIQQLQQRMVSR